MIAIALFLVSIVAFLLILDTNKGILAALIARPIIDCFWGDPYIILRIKPTEIMGVIFPTLIFFSIINSIDKRFIRYPFSVACYFANGDKGLPKERLEFLPAAGWRF